MAAVRAPARTGCLEALEVALLPWPPVCRALGRPCYSWCWNTQIWARCLFIIDVLGQASVNGFPELPSPL